MNLSRRSVLSGFAGLAVLATGLTACNASATDEAASPSAAPAGAEEGAFPVTIEDKFGSTTITTAPTRIVTVGLKEQDDLLALGIVPVGATKWLELEKDGIFGSWADAALGDSPLPVALEFTDGIQFEQIAALTPDLIIALYAGLTDDDHTKLKAIAPVIAQPKGVTDYGIAWDVQAETVGKAVGQPAKMAGLIAATKKVVEDAKTANPTFAGQTGLVGTSYEGLYLYGTDDPRSRLLGELGFVLPPDLKDALDTQEFGGNISAERAEILNVGALLWFGEAEDQAKLLANKVIAQQPVVKEGRILFLQNSDTINNAFSFVTVLSLPFLVEGLVPRLLATVDGDPSTPTTQQ